MESASHKRRKTRAQIEEELLDGVQQARKEFRAAAGERRKAAAKRYEAALRRFNTLVIDGKDPEQD